MNGCGPGYECQARNCPAPKVCSDKFRCVLPKGMVWRRSGCDTDSDDTDDTEVAATDTDSEEKQQQWDAEDFIGKEAKIFAARKWFEALGQKKRNEILGFTKDAIVNYGRNITGVKADVAYKFKLDEEQVNEILKGIQTDQMCPKCGTPRDFFSWVPFAWPVDCLKCSAEINKPEEAEEAEEAEENKIIARLEREVREEQFAKETYDDGSEIFEEEEEDPQYGEELFEEEEEDPQYGGELFEEEEEEPIENRPWYIKYKNWRSWQRKQRKQRKS